MPRNPQRSHYAALLALCVGLIGPALSASADDSDAKAKEALAKLQGRWNHVSLTIGGRNLEVYETISTIAGDVHTMTINGQPRGKFSIAVRPEQTPAQIDMILQTPAGLVTTVEGIYKLEGDTLTICTNPGPQEGRPLAFASKEGSRDTLSIYKKADPPKYKVLGVDKGHVAIVNAGGKVEWETPSDSEVHEVAQLPNGNILFTMKGPKVVEMTPGKDIIWQYAPKPKDASVPRVEIHAFQRLENGLTMVAETGNKRIVEVDGEGKAVREVPLTVEHPDLHRDTRMARKLANGHHLVCHEGDGTVREYDPTGKVVWSYKLDLAGRPRSPGHGVEGHGTEVYGAIRKPDGNTLIACGNGNRVIEVDRDGKIVWSIGQDELPGIRLAWVTTLELLPNGNLIVGNTHAGPENPQLFEVTRDKKVVWTFKDFKNFGNSLAATQVLGVEGPAVR